MLAGQGQAQGGGGRRSRLGMLRTLAQIGTIGFSAYNIITDYQNIACSLQEGAGQVASGLDMASEGLLMALLGLGELLSAALIILLPPLLLAIIARSASQENRRSVIAVGALGVLLVWLIFIPKLIELLGSGLVFLTAGGSCWPTASPWRPPA